MRGWHVDGTDPSTPSRRPSDSRIGPGTARSREMHYPVTRDIIALLPLAAIKDKRDNRGARCTDID